MTRVKAALQMLLPGAGAAVAVGGPADWAQAKGSAICMLGQPAAGLQVTKNL